MIKLVTIEDVAKRANTSIATVSRVLNNRTGYSEKTKLKVQEAIEELGYESNAIARSLKNKKTNTIGVLVPNVSSMLSNEILNGIEEYAHTNGYSVLTSYTYSDSDKVMKSLKTFNEQRVDGLIFVSDFFLPEYYEYVRERKMPIVLTAAESPDYPLSFIKVDDFKASYDAVSYLIAKGHKKIGMISANPQVHPTAAGKSRLEGYKKALQDAALNIEDQRIVFCDGFIFPIGRNKFKELIEMAPDITAVFASSDDLAVGALNMAYELGIQVPKEVSIIGYDNIPITEMVWPPLATVSQPLKNMGYESTKELMKKIEDPKKEANHRYIAHEIIERKSVADLN